jgi:hypothetical protein
MIFLDLQEESSLSEKETEIFLEVQDGEYVEEPADQLLKTEASLLASEPKVLPKKLSNPPKNIKAIYLTGWSAGSSSYFEYLKNILELTEINAVVIDIKDYSGLVSYNADIAEVRDYNLTNWAIRDINSLINFFHLKNIYVIGRICVFQDPAYSKIKPWLAIYDKQKTEELSELILWKDYKNLSWVDPASEEVWKYNVSLAKEAFLRGFDEINFDYIRFPSDGNLKNMGFPVWNKTSSMQSVIRDFYQYLRSELPGEKISADLFGLTTVNFGDIGIGQIIEDSFEFFDYVSPMVYPSHYAVGFIGFQNPAEYPYEVVKYSIDSALARKIILEEKIKISNQELFQVGTVSEPVLAKIRPWLQDFNLGAKYTQEMVSQQINAVKDSLKEEYAGYMLWNPSNIYTTGAVLK